MVIPIPVRSIHLSTQSHRDLNKLCYIDSLRPTVHVHPSLSPSHRKYHAPNEPPDIFRSYAARMMLKAMLLQSMQKPTG